MKKLSLSLLLLALAAGMLFPSAVIAAPSAWTQINYFSDATKSTLVGQRCYTGFRWVQWGVRTSYTKSDINLGCDFDIL